MSLSVSTSRRPGVVEISKQRTLDGVSALVITRPTSPTLTATLTALLLGEVVPGRVLVLEASGSSMEGASGSELSAGVRAGLEAARKRASGAGANANVALEGLRLPGENLAQVVNRYLELAAGPSEAPAGPEASGSVPAPGTWLWILHEDSAPEAGALLALHRRGSSSRAMGAVGSKQVGWNDRKELLEVGIRATRSARRVPEVEPGDRDGGQLDGRSDVLGVGTAGMLIRTEALQAVGGFDPVLGPFGDGLEISRRLRAAGWRVVVEPAAVVRHAQLSLGTSRRSSYARRRGAQVYNAVLAAPAILAPLVFLWYILAAVPRAIWRLLCKEPRLAEGEIRGGFSLLAKIPALLRARARLRKTHSAPRGALRELEDRPSSVRRAKREIRRAEREQVSLIDLPDPLVLRERAHWRGATRVAGWIALLFGVLLAVGFALPNVGAGALAGGAYLPDAWTGTDLLRAALHSWLPSGDGSAQRIDAFWLLFTPFALLGQPLGENLGNIGLLALYASFPLAAAAAFWASGTLTNSPHIRAISAIAWAAAPPLVAAVLNGHIPAAALHVFLPVALGAVMGAWRARENPHGPQSSAGIGVAALAFVVLGAAAPVMLLVSLLVAAAGVWRWRQIRWFWIAAAPWALVGPSLGGSWRIFFAHPGPQVAGRPSWLGLMTFSPSAGYTLESAGLTGAGAGSEKLTGVLSDASLAIPLLAALAILIAALCSLLRHRNWRGIRRGWLLAAAGFAWAGLSTRFVSGVAYQGSVALPAYGWAGTGLSVALLGFFLVLVCAGDGLRTDISVRSFGPHQLIGLGSVALVILAALASGAHGVYLASGGSALRAVPATRVPALAVEEQNSAARSRVLALFADDAGVRAEVWRGPGKELHEVTMNDMAGQSLRVTGENSSTQDPASEHLAAAVADLLAGNPDAAGALAEHAVSMVLIPDGASDALAGALNAAPDLEYVTENETGMFWRVSAELDPSRLRLGGTHLDAGRYGVHITLPAGPAQRLDLTERADAGWVAKLDGKTIAPAQDLWNQTWQLPERSEEMILTINYNRWFEFAVAGGQGLFSLAVLIVALPLRRRTVVTA